MLSRTGGMTLVLPSRRREALHEKADDPRMFTITRQAHGRQGAFVKLVRLESDDYAVIVRPPGEGGLQNRYLGPDLSQAEAIFDKEVANFIGREGTRPAGFSEEGPEI